MDMRPIAVVLTFALAAGPVAAQDPAAAAVQQQVQLQQQQVIQQQQIIQQQQQSQDFQDRLAAARAAARKARAAARAGAVVSVPTFWPQPDAYPVAITVTLSDDTPGAFLFYTTDGSSPTMRSTPYNGPIPIVAPTTIRAIAVGPSGTTSDVLSGDYTIGPTAAVVPK
jgi:Fn3 associated